jgi:hypothetical protein
MKNLFLSFVALAIISNVNAQIPNTGFENWTSIMGSLGSYNNPEGWGTLNDLTTAAAVYTAEKGTPGSPGSSYLKLTSKTAGPTVVNGVAVSGVLNPSTLQPVSGFAYAGQPAALTGKWQHMIYGSSQGSISALLTRWDAASGMRVTVATANVTLSGMAMSWANFSIPFNYLDAQAPDSCVIILKASGLNPTNMDYLWVDNLSLSGNVASLSENLNLNSIQIFPNPSAELITVSFNSTDKTNYTIQILNLSGQMLQQKNLELINGKISTTFSVGALSKGTYFVRITDQKTTVTRSIILN